MPVASTTQEADVPSGHHLPAEWAQLVTEFTKAVYRECRVPDEGGSPALHRPKALFQFAAQYFEAKQTQQNACLRRSLQLSQCQRLYRDLCAQREDDAITIAELNAYSLGFGCDRQAFKDLLRLSQFQRSDPLTVHRVEFVAFACALQPAGTLPDVVRNLCAVFGEHPPDFRMAVEAIARVDVQHRPYLQGLLDAFSTSPTITYEELARLYPAVTRVPATSATPSDPTTPSVS
eukprot:GGOE01061182.1.p1 GENE.GGOE01061182.1~~GGOE01061182.1.p1  ORF type:complete len:233 (-),score=60.00 GGOE01061182.1:121-819(-)